MGWRLATDYVKDDFPVGVRFPFPHAQVAGLLHIAISAFDFHPAIGIAQVSGF